MRCVLLVSTVMPGMVLTKTVSHVPAQTRVPVYRSLGERSSVLSVMRDMVAIFVIFVWMVTMVILRAGMVMSVPVRGVCVMIILTLMLLVIATGEWFFYLIFSPMTSKSDP